MNEKIRERARELFETLPVQELFVNEKGEFFSNREYAVLSKQGVVTTITRNEVVKPVVVTENIQQLEPADQKAELEKRLEKALDIQKAKQTAFDKATTEKTKATAQKALDKAIADVETVKSTIEAMNASETETQTEGLE